MERFRNEVNPEELAMLQRVLDDYCIDHGVTANERDNVALSVMNLFRRGVTDEETLRERLRRFLA
ncbi:MAG: hypothetical protein KKB66_18515 [Alphaproteobacteria bacterium]|uniref:Uncharacterized protein n=1 Tax=viral metagenome TaxID=1070528 RepID=A0A6H1ZHD8_9ZZZZ|nr:hypothetical protein [Alphaproteobacteria bacterium]MBU0803598.1 hypothetical protein [Alphaproteobacteria bacterium]MBU0873105.1 hypothetical protein [Alphaproteobacteria bacterium]MBU1402525.1 hypothetical protein [Alphaproteobacteria bacterium]MBU1593167.1 hypothetical protein [Alphaproteobacteria bacterium]